MTSAATTIIRLLRIITLVNQARRFEYPNAVKLSAKFKIDLRTAKRDIAIAKQFLNVPLAYSGKERGFYLAKDFSFDNLDYNYDKILKNIEKV